MTRPLTPALSDECASHGVEVNAIAPGSMRTANTAALPADPKRSLEILHRIPAHRWGEPSDLEGAVVFLASHASDDLTGHVMAVDGGWCGRSSPPRRGDRPRAGRCAFPALRRSGEVRSAMLAHPRLRKISED